MTPPDQQRRALLLACLALVACAGVFWAIWSVPLVLTNDGPQAVLISHMESHYDDPGSIYARQFSVGLGLSGRGFSFLYASMASLFSWPNSLRVSQLLIVLALALGIGWLSKAVAGRAGFSSLLGFVVAFSWPFYMGFYAFCISTAVGLMLVAFVVSRSEGLSRVEKAAVSTALLVQLVLHGFAVLITLFLVALVVLTRRWMQRKTTAPAEWSKALAGEAAWLGVSCLPSVIVILVMRSGQAEMATVQDSAGTEWASLSEWAMVLPRLATPSSRALGIAVFALALTAIVRTASRLRSQARTPEDVALATGAVVLLGLALALPLNVPGWQFFAPRFLTTGLAVSLSLLAKEKVDGKRARIVVGVGVVALVGWAVVSARALHHRLATACEDALVGLEHEIPRSFVQLPITFDATCGLTTDPARSDVPYAAELLHFASLFAVRHGGTVPYVFAGPAAVHAFVPRAPLVPVPSFDDWGLSNQDPRLVNPTTRAALLTKLALFGTDYENVLFFGATTDDRALLLDRGYVIDFEHRSFINAHFDACPVEVAIEHLPDDHPLLVTGGFGENEIWTAKIAPTADRRALKASLRMFCGDVWVRVSWQGSEERCADADTHGRIALRTGHAITRVDCRREPIPR